MPIINLKIQCFTSQEEISESDVDPHFKHLFKQIAGNVGNMRTDSERNM